MTRSTGRRLDTTMNPYSPVAVVIGVSSMGVVNVTKERELPMRAS
jgi:hypothetical protein